MKFHIQEILIASDIFDKEMKDFGNNVRTQLGIIIKGTDPSIIQAQHLKFLTNIKSPFPLILMLRDYKICEGWLVSFD